MGGPHLPVILIEVVLVFGGVLAFGWWQLRSVKRDQQRTRERAAAARAGQATTAPPADGAGTP
jgi:hypothetical protein